VEKEKDKNISIFFSLKTPKLFSISGSMRCQVRENILVTISVLHGSMQQQ
jgi:hypothetical protein